ncbi:hypothetical protein CVT26_005944 [Gymnopilus dilepis]|uniref:Uncharacterized protein n=1 Tax=Gymnopilus dilepis TaxID=231916 RepID=A0A409WBU4_9AGAR|nr:hypothetical protein CVT26_005944 [Gymnopilus dilepis]
MVQHVELPQPPRRFLKTSKARFAQLGIYGNSDLLEPENGFDPTELKPNCQSVYDEAKWPVLDYLQRVIIALNSTFDGYLRAVATEQNEQDSSNVHLFVSNLRPNYLIATPPHYFVSSQLTPHDLQDLCWEEGPVYILSHIHYYLVSELRHRAWQKFGGPQGFDYVLRSYMHYDLLLIDRKVQDKKRADAVTTAVKQSPSSRRPKPVNSPHSASRAHRASQPTTSTVHPQAVGPSAESPGDKAAPDVKADSDEEFNPFSTPSRRPRRLPTSWTSGQTSSSPVKSESLNPR